MRPPFVFKDAPGLLTLPLALMLFAIAVVFRRLPIVALVAVILGIGLVVLPFLPRQGHATRRAADAASETDLVCRGTLYWHGGGWWRLPSWATNGPLGELRVSPTGIRIGVQPWLGGSLFFPPPIEVPLSEIRSLSRARWHLPGSVRLYVTFVSTPRWVAFECGSGAAATIESRLASRGIATGAGGD
jgi:hypothetical protein